MSYDPKDDVDRLFACFKCGVSPPQSAVKERKLREEKSKKPSFTKGESSVVSERATPNTSKEHEDDPPEMKKLNALTSTVMKLRSGKKISPIVFYGSPQGAPVKKPSHLLRLLHEIRVDLKNQNDLIPRDKVWATFPRQEEAMRFSKVHAQTNVFSYQDHLTGQRRYLVSTYDEFWRRYKSMDSRLRHHYEVIQEGSPCHLYFDLEFDKKVNTDKEEDAMVDILISITLNVLFDKYSIKGSGECIVELDSSTTEKFSRHLIIHLPKAAFKDNLHAGAFVSEVCSRIASLRGSDPKIDKLYIRKDTSFPDSLSQLFLDSSVYSRNRCFRLPFSSKAGKSSFLSPTGRFKCKNMNEKQVFMESLICRMDKNCTKLLVCKMDLDCKKTLCFDSEVSVQEKSSIIPFDVHRSDFVTSYFMGKSPFPALDAFVESIASIGSISGKIRSWYWFSPYGLMVYSMSRSRYCERIGREHKSNHVIYVVDLQKAGYYQKCHDPDCRGYRSPLRPLPLDVTPDCMAIQDSTESENCRKVLDINFDPQLDSDEMQQYMCNDEMVTDSCKKEYSWWQEAVRYADCIEKMGDSPKLYKLDDGIGDDFEWWMDAEKFASQIEGQID
ncbi:uncharacterized protein [Typha latifolia]|uniref:uncharacterized protein isoform X1 n=1 Tax=Typha latifolia TaxID=4733 RepID=UPI003C2B54AD